MTTTLRPTLEAHRTEDVDLFVDFAYAGGLDTDAGEEITTVVEVKVGYLEGATWRDVTSEFVGTPAPSAVAATGETALTLVRWRKKAAATTEQLRTRNGYDVRAVVTITGGFTVTRVGKLVIDDAPKV